MQIPKRLKSGDTVAIVSLSSGILGESFMEEQRGLIEKRLNEFGLKVIYGPHALASLDYIDVHPEKRASDLKWAFNQDNVAMVLCAIGGRDTYRTLPYLLEDSKFIKLVAQHPKVFLGYSDSSINHLMFQKLGLASYYGMSAIVDFGELDEEMLPYSKNWFSKMFTNEIPEITSSPIWYEERTQFGSEIIGIPRISHPETHGFESLFGNGTVTGTLFGGCLESIGDLLLGDVYDDEKEIAERYDLLPTDMTGKILFLETSEEKPSPDRVRIVLNAMKIHGLFTNLTALIIGKPQDEAYYDDYKAIYVELGQELQLPILYNLNFGHAHPHCILPIGQDIMIDFNHHKVQLLSSLAD
ncbi:S66 peptidase family protein [Lactococcus ileimucosae]|uniref:S66 peptidase family protein n=1 Tax=Lactococcus ileimucosae TaxID=2941329 RepID=A0ABV4D6U7_9LACT